MKLANIISRLTFSCFLLGLTMAIFGCGDDIETPLAPKAAANKPKRTLIIGVVPEQDIFKQKERYQPLAEYLGHKVNVTIVLKVLPRYGNIVSTFEADKLDGAFLGSYTYTLLHMKLGVEPLARPVNLDGSSTYHGVLFVRKDSGIRSSLDMQGKRFAFVDQATAAGFLLPMHYFKDENIADYQTWFHETYFAGTHADVINDVFNKKADAGAAKNTMFERLTKDNKRLGDEMLILARSPEFPENVLAVRDDLDFILQMQIKNVLLTMDTSPDGKVVLDRFGAQKFIETHDHDYQPVYQYAAEIGLALTPLPPKTSK